MTKSKEMNHDISATIALCKESNSQRVHENIVAEAIVIPDECGDSLWDEVLEQEYPVLKYANIIF